MNKSPPNGIFLKPPHSKFSTKEGRSGYEPSDTETEWQEIPRHERERKNKTLGFDSSEDQKALKNPMALYRRNSSRYEFEISSPGQSRRRHHSKSPYRPPIPDNNDAIMPIPSLDIRRNISPLPKPNLGRHSSPYGREELRTPNRRSVTAPRLRLNAQTLLNGGRSPSPLSKGVVRKQREVTHLKAPSIGEINEMAALAKLSKDPTGDINSILSSTDSIQPGDIFFSRECNPTMTQKTSLPSNNHPVESHFSQRPKIVAQVSTPSYQKSRGNDDLDMNIRGKSSRAGSSRFNTVSSSAAMSHSGDGNGKILKSNSMTSYASGKTTTSVKKFTDNIKKSQRESWFSCMRLGACNSSRKSPEHRTIDEASFIERALVVESLPQFWADKYQPASLNGFICHKQEAKLLKELMSKDVCPHILLKGPSGSGKRALAMALLREIYGDACWNLSHDIRQFPIQEKRFMKVNVPIASSSHHMELNVHLEPNAKYALMGLVRDISTEHAIPPEVSTMTSKSDYKVIVLYEVDKAAENIQHLVKWIIDCYSDICKLVVCCEDDADILETVKNRFKVIEVDAPPTHEIVEVLIQISKEEGIDLSVSFATKIATKSKQNIRKAIMSLEACKAHNYPFSDEQPIPFGWEESLIEIAAEILDDPSYSRLFSIRGKMQKLLLDFVHPKLILLKLTEQLVKRTEASLKRELYYWRAYYDKRLPPGTTALLKLEEFVAKFMSIYRKSSSSRQCV